MSETIPFEHVRAISDPQRLAILRRLMGKPATLSQLGEHFDETAAHIRHHLKVLESAGLVELCEVRPVRGFLEKYYRATSYALRIHFTIIPEEQRAVTIGSMDYAVASLASHLAGSQPGLLPLVFPLSSLDALISLRQGVCQMATTHLVDPESGEYNRPYLRSLFPGQRLALVHLFRREEGLMLAPGNPKGIREIADLARPDVRLARRELGSGVRVWLDMEVKHLGIPVDLLEKNALTVRSHQEAAQSVAAGNADVSVGIRASAVEHQLDFLPLFQEPYELVLLEEEYHSPRLVPFFELLNSGTFQAFVRASKHAEGYDNLEEMGTMMVVQ